MKRKSWIIFLTNLESYFLTNLESYFWQSWFVFLKGVRYWVDQLAWFIIWVSTIWSWNLKSCFWYLRWGFLWGGHNSQLHQHDSVELSQGPQSTPRGGDFLKSDGEPVWVELCPWTQFTILEVGIYFPKYLLRWPQYEAQMWAVWMWWGLCREWAQTDKIWRKKIHLLTR